MKIKICVVGLGYVGLPLACLLSKKYQTFGFDVSDKKIANLKNGIDETGEVQKLKRYKIEYSTNPEIIKEADFIIVAVPTPITKNQEPDLSLVKKASQTVGQNLTKGSIVVYESTVYPGATQEICLPILEQESGLKLGSDFKIGYSPERVNPGDKEHTIDKVFKVVSGSDQEALDTIAKVYGSITKVHKASSIKVAEAAKVIENIQRDLNIALMNELALIFDRLGIDTKEVIQAAGTKWNFHKYLPGLVGGHCIGVDPYYLTYKAKEVGYDPKVILAGRAINESMASFVASKLEGKKKVLVLGLTFKENVPDIRNSKAKNLILKLVEDGSVVYGLDPMLEPYSLSNFGISAEYIENKKVVLINQLNGIENVRFDAIVLFSPHDEFRQEEYSLKNLKNICNDNPTLFDIKGFYSKKEAVENGFNYLTL